MHWSERLLYAVIQIGLITLFMLLLSGGGIPGLNAMAIVAALSLGLAFGLRREGGRTGPATI